MRILLVSTDYLPLIGGVAQHVSGLARALHQAGDEVTVLTVDRFERWSDRRRTTREEPATADAPRVIRVPYVVNRAIRFLSGRVTARMSFNRFAAEVQRVARALQPDIIHWHALDRWRNDLWRGLPGARVWTNHTSDFITGLRHADLRRRYSAEARAADHVIAPSEELRELTRSVGIPSERATFIPNGVDAIRFRPHLSPEPWRTRLAVQPGERVVLCPRRLDPKNGVLVFVRAARALLDAGRTDARFVLAGDASGTTDTGYAAEVMKATRDTPHAARFALLGAMRNADMPGLYAVSDLVVVPSFIEATSIAALEAMACAKPVVAGRTGGLPHLIREGENGFLFPPGDERALGGAMDRLLADAGLRDRLGAQGRARVERDFSWPAVALATKRVYERARAERVA